MESDLSLPQIGELRWSFGVAILLLVLGAIILFKVCSGIMNLFQKKFNAPFPNFFHALALSAVVFVAAFAVVLTLARSHVPSSVDVVVAPRSTGYVLEDVDTRPASFIDVNSVSSSLERPSNNDLSKRSDTLWLPITRDMLTNIASDETTRELQTLTSKIPQDISQAYAMIPLTGSGPGSAQPVIRQVLSPAAIRYILTPKNLKTIATGLAACLPVQDDVAADVSPDAAEAAEAELSAEASEVAEWVNQTPGIGQMVVTSQFAESTTPAEEALRPAIVEALKTRMTKLCSQEFGIGEGWQKLIDVSMSDSAVRQCIVKTDRKVEVLSTVDGSKMMQQTYALIEFPESAERQILNTVRKELVKSRTAAICITLLAVWLCGVLLTFLFQASQQGSILRKLATVPVMAVLMLPCLLVAIAMMTAMAKGDVFELTWGDGRISCVVDNTSE